MANELRHKTVGEQLTQAEFEAVGLHVLNSQATGDLIIATSATQLSRLAKITTGQYLKATATGYEGATPATGATIVRKTADETINNTDTLQNDDELLFPIAAGEIWEYTILILHNSSSSPDIKFAITVPANATLYWAFMGKNQTGTTLIGGIVVSGGAADAYGDGDDGVTIIKGIAVATDTAGNVQLQWAQNSQQALDTKVLVNSNIIANQLV